jgi:hypothetical protein
MVDPLSSTAGAVRPPAWLRYLWASPNSLLGLGLAAAAGATGGGVALVDGVVEVEGGVVRTLLEHAFLIEGGASAMTLGHVVVARDAAALSASRAHERAHVRQAERWGPLFLPAYVVASAVALLRGGHHYRDNAFERAARLEEKTAAPA